VASARYNTLDIYAFSILRHFIHCTFIHIFLKKIIILSVILHSPVQHNWLFFSVKALVIYLGASLLLVCHF